MRTKEACIKDLEFHILSYNEYWEDPIRDSVLWQFTDEVCKLIKSYLDIIKVQGKKSTGNYESYSDPVKNAISEIVRMVNDGRQLRKKVEYFNFKKDPFNDVKSKLYDHNVEDNGYLKFENNPFLKMERIEELCDELLEIINSEEKTSTLSKYLGRIFYFEGYESGSFIVRFTKIGFNDKEGFVFDGEVIELVTPDSAHGGCSDGVLFYDAENMPFYKIPYYREEIDTEEELAQYLETIEEFDENQMKEAVAETITFCFENTFNIYE